MNNSDYIKITGNYWAFTLTDGALRMLVVLYFHQLGFDALSIAFLFLFYEVFGVVTNLLGGWLGAKIGLNHTMNLGLLLQVGALLMLAVPVEMLSVAYVMLAQALSGIAKDLNKLSAKSSIKALISSNQQGTLFKWIALLTGSKNALKGVGFFIGGLLLSTMGFSYAVTLMAGLLFVVWLFSVMTLTSSLGKAKNKTKFTELFSKSPLINRLSAARLLLFGARDVWFVVALPIYLTSHFEWANENVGAFMAFWVIGYGGVQSIAPRLLSAFSSTPSDSVGKFRRPSAAFTWVLALSVTTLILAMLLSLWESEWVLVIGLLVFGAIFAVNSSLHSYLIVSYADQDGVSLDVGFYYMANAMGRLIGTVLSGYVYVNEGLIACLMVSAAMLFMATVISYQLPTEPSMRRQSAN